ncbi:hypothetical protein [Deinococcus sp. UYEF24]
MTFDIDIDVDGPSDADFRAVAERYARNQFRRDIKNSFWRQMLAVLGLYNEPNAAGVRRRHTKA